MITNYSLNTVKLVLERREYRPRNPLFGQFREIFCVHSQKINNVGMQSYERIINLDQSRIDCMNMKIEWETNTELEKEVVGVQMSASETPQRKIWMNTLHVLQYDCYKKIFL